MAVESRNPESPNARVPDAFLERDALEPSIALPKNPLFRFNRAERLPIKTHPRLLRDAACVLAIAIADLIAAFAATAAGFAQQRLLKDWLSLKDLTLYTWVESALFLFIVLSLGFLFRGLYLRREPLWETLRLTVGTCVLSGLVMVSTLYLTKIADSTPRSLAILAAGNLVLLAPLLRIMMLALLRSSGLWYIRVLVVGEENTLAVVARELEADWGLGYRVVMAASTSSQLDGVTGIDEIIVIGKGYDSRAVSDLIEKARWIAGAVTLIPDLGFLPFGSAASRVLPERGHVLLTSRNLLTVRGNLIVKRSFDLVVSAVAIILTCPLFMLIAFAIRVTSPGPAVFSQERIGKRGNRFRCLKFRSMYLDAELRLADLLSRSPENRAQWERYFKLRDDPRVTPIGRWLRRTSLDELPQLLNIVSGAMSLVGPRPLPAYHYEQIPGSWAADYLDVRPGLTGAWQVGGRSECDINEMAFLNSWYVRNWSLWLDLTLLLRTIPVVIFGRGAF